MPPRWSKALYAFLIFLFVGPLFGALAFGLLVTAASLVTDPNIGLSALYASIVFAPLAYLIGGLQAGVAGAATGAAILRWGYAPRWASLGAALVAGALYVSRAHEEWSVSAILIAVHLLAALACWLIVRAAR